VAAWAKLCETLLVEKLQIRGEEDIIISYAATAATGRLNKAHRFPFENLDFADSHSLSRLPGHLERRTAVTRWCRAELLRNPSPETAGAIS
jgi:hypothetical protein